MPKKNDSNNLLNPTSAVEDYFDTLLQEEATTAKPAALVKPSENLLIMPGLEEDLAKIEQSLEETKEVAIDTMPCGQPEKEPGTGQQEAHAVAPAEPTAGDQQTDLEFPLQCLMFNVRGNQLSIPLMEMGSVLNWDENMTRLPNAPSWFLGLIKHRGRNVKVVDSAGILSIPSEPIDHQQQHILVFADDDWAITCDQLGEVVQLDKEDVQWRSSVNSSLAMGTIKQSLAMLLAPAKILAYLNRSEDRYC